MRYLNRFLLYLRSSHATQDTDGFFDREVAKIRIYCVHKAVLFGPRCELTDSALTQTYLPPSPPSQRPEPPVRHSILSSRYWIALLLVSTPALVSGCAVYTVADAAVSVVVTGVKVTAKVVGAAVDAVTPDDDAEETKKNNKNDKTKK